MNRRLSLFLPIVAIAAIACGGTAPSASPSPTPVPSAPAPSGAPTGDIVVDLNTVGGGPVRAIVKDESGEVVGASSGDPADGVSVDFDAVRVESVDADTIQLTFSDYPAPNEYTVAVSNGADGGITIAITRPEPTETTDSIGLDRVLVLDFDGDVAAADVDATIQ